MATAEDQARLLAVEAPKRRFWENLSKWGFVVPVILSGAAWLMSLETRLHEHAERLTQENASFNELEKRVRMAEIVANDPRPRPQAVVEFEAMKKVLDERGARINSIDARVNQLQAAVDDPRPKPETAVEMQAMRAMLQERGDRINRLEENMNALSRTLLERALLGRDTRPAQKR